MGLGIFAGLEGDVAVVVVGADGAFSASNDEAAFRLRLDRPRIGEGAPTRFEFGETMRVTRYDDAMFVDFEALRFIHRSGDFQRTAAALIPCAQRRSVPEVVEQGAASMRFFIKP